MQTTIHLAMLIALVAVGGALVAVAEAAQPYDLANCGASTVTTLAESGELTVLVFDTKGIARSTPEKGAFDNATYHCVNVLRIAGAQREGSGYCKSLDPDGDFVVGQNTVDAAGASWKFLHGTWGSGRASRAAASLSR